MTALDPSPTAVLHLEGLRELIGTFLDRPSADRLRAITEALQAYVQLDDDPAPELAAGREAIAGGLNRLSWSELAGQALTEAHRLRHEVLAQLDRHRALRR